jgi:hypothetical protein
MFGVRRLSSLLPAFLICAGCATETGAPDVAGTEAMVTSIAGADVNGIKNHPDSPTAGAIQFAHDTSDLMTNMVVTGLFQEINATTPANVAQGSLAIGLVFNDRNRDMRLVGALQPLSQNDIPSDEFEHHALELAISGIPATSVEKDAGRWFYRRSIPLSNSQPQCAMCHTNFSGLAATEWVGALMVRVPIDSD